MNGGGALNGGAINLIAINGDTFVIATASASGIATVTAGGNTVRSATGVAPGSGRRRRSVRKT